MPITDVDGTTLLEVCAVCQRSPTARFSFRANSGFVLLSRTHEFDGSLCSICSTGMFRQMQAHNITRGPWGFVSLIATPFYLVRNWWSYAKRRALTPPTPFDPTYDTETGLGRPVFTRLGVWAVIVLFAVGAYALSTDTRSPWETGACAAVDQTAGTVSLTPCTSPYDARVVAVTATESSCPAGTSFWIHVDDGVACFEQT